MVFRTAEALLRGNEAAWELHDRGPSRRGVTHTRPLVRFDRGRIMARLGAHYRRLAEAGADKLPAAPLDLSLTDPQLGAAIHAAVEADWERRVPYGNAGYEQTLTSPKSLSVAAFLADDVTREDWLDLVHDASVAATDGLMDRVGNARTGHEGDGQSADLIDGDGYAATVSIESYSRSLDPHLHGHVMMPNRIVCVDGVERGIANGGRDLINHAPWFQAEFERHLRALSVERGLVPRMGVPRRRPAVRGHRLRPRRPCPVLPGQRRRAGRTRRPPRGRDRRPHAQPAPRPGRPRQAHRHRHQGRPDPHLGRDPPAHDHPRSRRRHRPRQLPSPPPPQPQYTQPAQWDAATWAVAIDEHVCEHKSYALDVQIEAAVRAFAPHDWDDARIHATTETVKTLAFLPGEGTGGPVPAGPHRRPGVRLHPVLPSREGRHGRVHRRLRPEPPPPRPRRRRRAPRRSGWSTPDDSATASPSPTGSWPCTGR